MLVDSHCHLHDRQFFSAEQAEEMLARAKENGVERVVCIGTDPEDSLVAREFAESHEGAYWTFGIHPQECSKDNETTPFRTHSRPFGQAYGPQWGCSRYNPNLSSARAKKLVAIGEVGLDYHSEGYNREAQIRLFEEMLQLAVDNDLPVSFHVREAFSDFFAVINNFPNVRGVVHSFTDNKKVLKRILSDTDFYVGVNGLATYTTLPLPPLSRILLETDAPFLTPKPFRGIINEPAYIRNIAEWLAEKTDVDFETVERETTKNVEKLYRFSDSDAD